MIKNFKKKYIKNLLVYHLYRYLKYKLMYFKTFGAMGEDVLINKIFKHKNGFFVDVGALHPVNGSLTYNLYKRGWTGINIDIDKHNIKLFKLLRPKDQSINCAISSNRGTINSYIFSSGSGLNTLEKSWAEKWSKKINQKFSVRKIKKRTLNHVVKEYGISKNIELLNIDVEGHEVEVLKGVSFKTFRPKIITVEIHVKNTKEIFHKPIYKILHKNGYDLISQYYQTSFFKAKEFVITNI